MDSPPCFSWYKNIKNSFQIGFNGLQVCCIVGILPKERLEPQLIYIDLKVAITRSIFDIDEIHTTIDYTALAEEAKQIAQKGQYQLIETLAAEILKNCLKYSEVKAAFIRISKVQAIAEAQAAIVEVQHIKNDHEEWS